MTHFADLPLVVAILVAVLVLIGGVLTLLGAIGTLKADTFYKRLHMPTLGTTWGAGAILIGSMLAFSLAGGRLVIHELLITILVTVTTPVTVMLLARATLYRDRIEKTPQVPSFSAVTESVSQKMVNPVQDSETD
ncbi:monovalent cation/H(+) antiporter subunit G [Aquamicrobium segne]|uniref:Monovalent cation/H(+) antiporter subunit G n=1 Tax=Aquamicrobium segne TaxID=469547 RepID=A0ABW0H3C4_9HYPH